MRDRGLLHKNQLASFREWLQSEGWLVGVTPPAAIYEVLRVSHPTKAWGRKRIVFFAKLPPTAHITAQGAGIHLVKEYLSWKRRNSKR